MYRFGELAVETHICVWSLNCSREYYQAISINDETQICVSTACTSTPEIALGILMQAAGGYYLVACWVALFAPALTSSILLAALLPYLVGELSWCLWMLVKCADSTKWQERVRMNQDV